MFREGKTKRLTAPSPSLFRGVQAVAQHVLRPLANSKATHAATGRLELLHRLLIKYGCSETHELTIDRTLAFAAPLCDSASEKSREAAFSVMFALDTLITENIGRE